MKKFISILFTIMAVTYAYSQSAFIITDILESDEATFGQVCYISAVQQNLVEENATYDEAVAALYNADQISELIDAEEPVSYIDAAYIYSSLWNIKGGLMYRLTKGSPRYVFRQFQTDGIIDSAAEPKSHISGSAALSLYTSCLRKYGDFDITKVSMGE